MGPRNLSYSNSVLYSSVWTSVDTKRTSDYKSGFELRWAWAGSQECDSLDQKLKLEKKTRRGSPSILFISLPLAPFFYDQSMINLLYRDLLSRCAVSLLSLICI